MDLQEKVILAYNKVVKSVVSIHTMRIFEFFFISQPIEGIGSGVIVDSNGLIVTNAHVISGFEQIHVTLPNGETLPARIVGMDYISDIALLKIEGRVEPGELGDSDRLHVGQFIITVGNPFGHILGGPTLTFGIISGLNRTIRAGGRIFENLIQIDAAINPGNSGGPLVDLDGKIIGITTAMIPFAQGIGFAIPINEVKYFTRQLIEYGRIIRPWIGIYGATLESSLAVHLGIPVKNGVVIMGVVRGSPADRAGLQRGDVIISIDKIPVNNINDLRRILRSKRVGDYLLVEFYRGARLFSVIVNVEEARF
ncbi:MAG: trypsin [Thermoprotei archaeon]|nr:MAG: trypsin [Thermoprotei archaeon]